MFTDIMCMMAGFLCAYLIIRVVRSFLGGTGCVVFGLFWLGAAGHVWAGTWTVYVKYCNTGTGYGPAGRVNVSDAAYYPSSIGSNPGESPGACSSYATIDSTSSSSMVVYARTWVNIGGTWSQTSWSSVGTATESSPYITVNYSETGGISTTSQQIVCVPCYTNTMKCTRAIWYTLGTNTTQYPIFSDWAPGGVFCGKCYTNALGTDGSGNGIAFSINVMASGCLENDFTDVLLGQPGSTPTGGSGGSPGFNPPQGPSSGTNTPPIDPNSGTTPSYPTNLTGTDVLDRDLKHLEATMVQEFRLSDKTIQDSAGAGGGGVTVNVTNIPSDYTNLLKQLITNTAAINTNQTYISTNGPGLGTNMVNHFAWASNTVMSGTRSNWAQGWGQMTNGIGTVWNSAGSQAGGGDPMGILMPQVNGHRMTLGGSLFRYLRGGALTLYQIAPWVKAWIAWGLNVALMWLVFHHLSAAVRHNQLTFAMGSAISAGDSPQYLTRLGYWGAYVVVLGTLLAMIPVVTYSIIAGYGFVFPWAATGIVDSLASTGNTLSNSIMGEYYWNLTILFPFDVLFLDFVIWAAVFFAVEFYLEFLCALIILAKGFLPVFVFGIFYVCQTDDVQAGPVRLENLTGANVILSNGPTLLSVPVGVTEMTLEAGSWDWSTNGTVAVTDDYVCARFGSNTNGFWSLDVATGYTGVDWWVMGFNLGLTIFGTAWAVSAARTGFFLRVRE